MISIDHSLRGVLRHRPPSQSSTTRSAGTMVGLGEAFAANHPKTFDRLPLRAVRRRSARANTPLAAKNHPARATVGEIGRTSVIGTPQLIARSSSSHFARSLTLFSRPVRHL